jgi:hypothetical protein
MTPLAISPPRDETAATPSGRRPGLPLALRLFTPPVVLPHDDGADLLRFDPAQQISVVEATGLPRTNSAGTMSGDFRAKIPGEVDDLAGTWW